ncbi:MAG: hypothetical protein JSR77_11075 [Planctomycetes bacterium]|nr:hypothetical protein [Planctomycetota bacterium]
MLRCSCGRLRCESQYIAFGQPAQSARARKPAGASLPDCTQADRWASAEGAVGRDDFPDGSTINVARVRGELLIRQIERGRP